MRINADRAFIIKKQVGINRSFQTIIEFKKIFFSEITDQLCSMDHNSGCYVPCVLLLQSLFNASH